MAARRRVVRDALARHARGRDRRQLSPHAQFLNQTLHRYGIEVSTVPCGDYDALEDAIRPTTARS
jgi:hypothetical protein